MAADNGCLNDSRRFASGLVLLFILAVAAVAASLSQGATPGRAQLPEPVLDPSRVVVVSDRAVCSLLGNAKTAAGLLGQDGSHTVDVDGTVYWNFGDSFLHNGWLLPNAFGWSSDDDASDCIALTPATANGKAVPLLWQVPGELTVWPLGMERTGERVLHYYYASVVEDPTFGWRVAGVGLARYDLETGQSTRALDGRLLWQGAVPYGGRTFADQEYVYVFLDSSPSWLVTDTLLARVPKNKVELPEAYEYWRSAATDGSGYWVRLWDATAGSWSPVINELPPLWSQHGLHNGVEVAYNPFLERWLAVYTTGVMTSLSARAADALTGPWDASETTLVDCGDFHAPAQQGFLCYTGAQHEFYQRDGGRTIYVTYSNSDAYEVFLHEIRLAAPIVQWTDAAGRALYLPRGAAAEAGWQAGGPTFFASDIPAPGLAAVHRWQRASDGAIRYGPSAPKDGAYKDLGIDFYAPGDEASAAALHADYAPVYRWSAGSTERYSALDLGPSGFTRHEAAFYGACPDSDGDKLSDCEESFLATSSASADTDGDGMSDAFESNTPGCDPLVYSEDHDGIEWWREADLGTHPCRWDSGAWGCQNAPLRDPGCDVDTDGDGCMDAWELGRDPISGGRRDPANPWDFYDTNGDRVVSLLGDIVAVSSAMGHAGGPRYSPALDRSVIPLGDGAWTLGPPDGFIGIRDVLSAASQFGHSCR